MKVIIISDFEGISGVYTFRQVVSEFGKPFEKARTSSQKMLMPLLATGRKI